MTYIHLKPGEPLPPDPRDQAATLRAEDADYYRTVLRNLIDVGSDLTALLQHEAVANSRGGRGDQPTADFIIAYDRVARAIRRTVALASKIAEPPKLPATQPTIAKQRAAARRAILRDVENSIAGSAPPPEATALRAELYERIDSPDIEDDIHTRPIPEIIAELRRDLGLPDPPPDEPAPVAFPRRTAADLQALITRAAAPRLYRPDAGDPPPW